LLPLQLAKHCTFSLLYHPVLPTSADEGLMEGLSFKGCCGGSAGFEDGVAGCCTH
jgi:hypothetical protein